MTTVTRESKIGRHTRGNQLGVKAEAAGPQQQRGSDPKGPERSARVAAGALPPPPTSMALLSVLVVLFRGSLDFPLEVADSVAEPPGEHGELLRPEKEHEDAQNEQELRESEGDESERGLGHHRIGRLGRRGVFVT